MGFKEHIIPPSACPACGHVMDRASGITDGDAPSPGSLTFCIRCGSMAVFDDGLKLAPPRLADHLALMSDPAALEKAMKLRAAIEVFKNRN